MSAVLEQNDNQTSLWTAPPVVVIGTGPVGVHFVEELLRHKPETRIVIYGNEPWEPYNRVKLAGLLTGETSLSAIQNPISLDNGHQVIQHHNCEIVAIDRKNMQVCDRLGNCQRYSKLVLATGSRPHIPNIEGIEQPGIFTFRNLDDAQRLVARRTRARRAVVLGGGLLGLEAARGLQKFNTEVTVVEHATRLMTQQLDDEAADLLREHILSCGIHVLLGNSVTRVSGENGVTGVVLRSGRHIDCDTMVIATGIRPNLQLARDARLPVGRGIRVNDHMQTSDPNVLAIGECSEHRSKIYGLVAPGLEQAGVAAHRIAGGSAQYAGSHAATRLKVVGVSLFSAGRTGERDNIRQLRALTWRSSDNTGYRRLLLKRNRLAGVIAYGEWNESYRIREAVEQTRYLWPWQRRRFSRYGNVWPQQDTSSVSTWPMRTVVCQCTGVTRGALGNAISDGHNSIEALCKQTGASSVCGSCKPLLADLLGSATVEPERGSRWLVWTGVAGLIAALAILFSPAVPFADSVQTDFPIDRLWRDGLIKQVTGFSLLGIGALVSLISLRKRIRRFSVGDFGSWRLVHVVFGTLAVAVLIAHTGLRLGHHINLYLMLSFTAMLLVGAIASGATGLQHLLPSGIVSKTRGVSLWMHILLLWPLPALLFFHVLKTYWF